MFAFLKKSDTAEKGSIQAAVSCDRLDYSDASLEAFSSHWRQVQIFVNKRSTSGEKYACTADDVVSAMHSFDKMCSLLADEHALPGGQHGPLLAFVLAEGLFDAVVNWCLCCGPEPRSAGQLELLRAFEFLIGHAHQPLLLHKPIMAPLLTLLSACGECIAVGSEAEERLVASLHALCLATRASPQLLELLFSAGGRAQVPRFLVFCLLVPYVHREGSVGQRARDALLLIMAASARDDVVGHYIAEKSDFCPVLATGLSALYSMLPRKVTTVGGDAWHRLERDDYADQPDVLVIINSLNFCNAVVQVAHPLVSSQLVAYIYDGFLIPVLGPALHQNASDDVVAATAYLELLLRQITEPMLMRAFLHFILLGRHDDITVLHLLIARINSHSKLCMVSLSLFTTLLDLCCEDVMYQLVLRYLVPCSHVMLSQRRSVGELDIYCKSAEKFLSFIPQCCLIEVSEEEARAAAPEALANGRLFLLPQDDSVPVQSQGGQSQGLRLSDYATDYNEYLADARARVQLCFLRCHKSWCFPYDGCHPSMDFDGSAFCADAEAPDATQKYDVSGAFVLTRLSAERGDACSIASAALSERSTVLNDEADECAAVKPAVQFDLHCAAAVASLNAERGIQASLSILDSCLADCSKKLNADELSAFLSYLDSVVDCDRSAAVKCTKHKVETAGDSEGPWTTFSGSSLNVRHPAVESVVTTASSGGSAEAAVVDRGLRVGCESTTMSRRCVTEQPATTTPALLMHPRQLSVLDSRGEKQIRSHSVPTLGPFLSVLLEKLEQMMHNSLYMNLMLTGVVARIACYPQPLLRSLLLSTTLVCQPTIKTLIQVLGSVKQKVDAFASTSDGFGLLLLQARKYFVLKENAILCRSNSSKNLNGRLSLPVTAPLPQQRQTNAPENRKPDKRKLKFPLLFNRSIKSKATSAVSVVKEGSSYRFLNQSEDALETPAARLEALKMKNAVYCAIILEEFAKELAAIAQEQTILAAAASTVDNYHGITVR